MPPKSFNSRTGFVYLSFLPWLILCIGLAITYLAQGVAQQHAKEMLQKEFNSRVNEIIANIDSRLADYQSILRGSAGLFTASQQVGRDEFHRYVSSLNLEQNYPGIQGVGYAVQVAPGEAGRLMETIRKEGYTHYAIWPAGMRETYTPVIYIEPFDWRNQRAFGYDMNTDPTRRAAMAHARDENRVIISGKVKLVQESGKDVQAGFLMYMPVYRNNVPHDTLAQRRANLQGWTFSPFRINELMKNGILGKHFDEDSNTLDLDIYDDDTSSAASLMYDAHSAMKFFGTVHHPVFQAARIINVGGHDWRLVVSSLPGFESGLKSYRASFITFAGVAISLLLALVVWLLINGRSRALATASAMTHELSASESRLKALFEHMSSGVVMCKVFAEGEDFIVTAFNRAAEKIDNIRNLPLQGKSIRAFFPDSGESGLLDVLRRVWQTGAAEQFSSSVSKDDRIVGWRENQIYKLADGTVVLIYDDVTERKWGEQALQASERYNRQLLGNLPAGIVVHNPDCTIRYINSAARAFFKFNAVTVGKRHIPDVVWNFLREDGSPMPVEELPERKVLADRQRLQNYVVGVVMNEQKDVRWALVNAFPDFDDKGAIRQVVVSFVDITERIQSDAQLRSARAELEHILNINPAAIYKVELGVNSTFFRSKGIIDMVGYEIGDWLESGFWASHIHPDDKEQVVMGQNLLLETGTHQYEYRFLHKDGHWVWILDRVNLVRDGNGKTVQLVGAWLDITPRKQAERALENLNRFYSVLSRVNEAIVRTVERDALFESICRIAVENGAFAMAWIGMVDETRGEIVPVVSWGHDVGYLDYLRSFGVLRFNGPTGQAIKKGAFRISQNVAEDPSMAPWRQEALERGYRSSAAFPFSLGNKVVGTITLYAGRPDFFDADVVNLLNDLSADVTFALGALDQQERRHVAEERLRQLNEELEQRVTERTWQLEAANKELEAFSYSVSHDLRAPLRSIDGFSEILEKRYVERLDDTGRDYLGRVRRASKRMGELIDDLLLLARVTRAELRKESVDLSRMLTGMVREMQDAAPQRQVEWDIQEGIVIMADSRLIKVVLENLLGNAWKFTGNQIAPRIAFGLIERDGEKILFMRDNGAGFNMQYAGKLFGAFQRLHKADEFEGTGIGLATVQRIIHRHGGRVWAEGQIAAGATFYFTI
ncbi:MAG: CHASE domain-containing protein [Sulfuriferula sp.]|nr:CHASE domain-containing protein [Sulfuriferula sp.]